MFSLFKVGKGPLISSIRQQLQCVKGYPPMIFQPKVTHRQLTNMLQYRFSNEKEPDNKKDSEPKKNSEPRKEKNSIQAINYINFFP